MRFLIVDDSRAMRMLMIRALRAIGHREGTFLQASNAEQAWDLIRGDWPDLVLCDWFMPEVSGMDRLNASGVEVRLGFVTSAADAESRRLAAERGALFVLNKPFTEEQLDKVVQAATRPEARPERPHQVPAAMREDASAYAIKRILQHLLHRETTSRVLDHALDTAGFKVPVVARYEHLDGTPSGAVATDLRTASRLAAALTLVPPAIIRDATQGNHLTGILDTNLREVLNVLGQLFTRGGRVQSRLSHIYFDGEPEPDELAALLSSPKWRSDVTVQVPRYGEGQFVLFGAGSPASRPTGPVRRITGRMAAVGRAES